jgi:hypothetical protein
MTNDKPSTPTEKKPYTKPVLRYLGSVKTLRVGPISRTSP